ncbi:helix-turn-helix domain-containing protein [Flexithrix dorotheae]|uniref:helix-turn-helix domain-containing protein n=1 Tax=Flexithrix dorotheae TaxID=70993 RepID=UPI00037C6516|nr:helix-turn-helix domain-containing protein [Flexithrix dorotheae]
MTYSLKHPPIQLSWLLLGSSLFVLLPAIFSKGLDYVLFNLLAYFNGENYHFATFLATVLPVYFLGTSLLLSLSHFKSNFKKEIQRKPSPNSSPLLSPPKNKITLAAERLKALLEKDQIFKNPELDLQKLAELLMVKPYLVRSIVKKTGFSTLAEMVSNYRITEACQILKEHGHKKNLKDIYYEVGYSTRKAFNADFKKRMGCTASEFLEEILKSKN